jgi:hypothetical protein
MESNAEKKVQPNLKPSTKMKERDNFAVAKFEEL